MTDPVTRLPRLLRTSLRIALNAAFLGAGIATIAYFLVDPVRVDRPAPLNPGTNAIWIQHQWFTGEKDEKAAQALGENLQRLGFRYIFAHVGPLNEHGGIPPYDPDQARRFLAGVRRSASGTMTLAWLGGKNKAWGGKVDLADPQVRRTVQEGCRDLLALGFDGIHLNIEPVADGDADFLGFLETIREAIGDRILSVAVMKQREWTFPHAWHQKWFWGGEYHRQVAARADQVVVMAYDTAIPLAKVYSWFVREQTVRMTQLAAESGNPNARVLIGLPTYDYHRLTHDPSAENLQNGLPGVLAALQDSRTRRDFFAGIAIYAHWVTSDDEWQDYRRRWPPP